MGALLKQILFEKKKFVRVNTINFVKIDKYILQIMTTICGIFSTMREQIETKANFIFVFVIFS